MALFEKTKETEREIGKENKIRKYKVDKETAAECFSQFCESWEIDCDKTSMNEEEKNDFAGNEAKITNAIMRGRLVLCDDGSLKYTISENSGKYNGTEITIKRPKGAAYMEMDRYKDREGVHKTYAVLAAMTGQTSAFYSSLDGIDLKPFMAIVALFLAG